MVPTTHELPRAAGLRATSTRTTVLGVLDEARRIGPAGHPSRDEGRVGDNHRLV